MLSQKNDSQVDTLSFSNGRPPTGENRLCENQNIVDLKVLSIKILNTKRRGIGTRSSIPIYTRETSIHISGTSCVYQLHDNFGAELHGYSTVAIQIQDTLGQFHPVELPKAIRKRLLKYLKDGPLSHPFDCNSLIHFLFGFGYRHGTFNECKPEWRYLDLLAGENPAVGQALLMLKHDRVGNPTVLAHMALYLGEGLYLSKSGRDGDLMVTDLANQKKLYVPRKMYAIEKVGK